MSHIPDPPFAHSAGPRNARIALVGEAFGEQEAMTGLPFMGYSGQELTRMLSEAGIARKDCFLTNVLALRPQGNDLATLCTNKKECGHDLKPISQSKYLRAEFLPELDRLKTELAEVRPNIVVALGNTACWALLGSAGITGLRGAVADSTLIPGLKVVPTWHPAAVLRQWSYRPILVVDLMKALREADFPEIRRPKRQVLINPSAQEVDDWIRETMLSGATLLSTDVETARGQITDLGIARSPTEAIVIPFEVPTGDGNYWPDILTEIRVRNSIDSLLSSPTPKVLQNGLYDLQFFLREGYHPRNFHHDTMLLSHSVWPELQKGLGFLGSIYTEEASWKLMNRHTETTKREE